MTKTTVKKVKEAIKSGAAVDLTYTNYIPKEKLEMVARAESPTRGYTAAALFYGKKSGTIYACLRSCNLFKII